MSVWLCIPSIRPGGGTIPLWQAKGYREVHRGEGGQRIAGAWVVVEWVPVELPCLSCPEPHAPGDARCAEACS